MKPQTSIRQKPTFEDAARCVPGGVNTSIRQVPPVPVFTRAQGARIWDAEGREYLDCHAAFGPIVLGHSHPFVNQRVAEAVGRLDLFGMGTTDLEIRLAQKIVEHVPCAEKVLLCNSGSEATYHAIRLARAVTGRKKILKFQGCYHGWHDYVLRNTLSAPEKIGARDPGSAGMLDEAVDATLVAEFNDLDGVERVFQTHRGEVAAIIIEPIPHNIGSVMPAPGFLEGLRDLARDQGALLIFDEVITGFRHSLGGYQKLCGVTPDLATFAKAMANGFPIAAVCGRGELMDRFNTNPGGDVFFAGTYNGHAVGCAASLATIEVMETENVHARLFELGERMRRGLAEIAARLKLKAIVAGFGSVYVLYFMEGPIRNYTDLMANDADRFIRYRRGLIERGVFEMPLNLKRACVGFSHTEADVDRILHTAEDVLKKLG
jgi:glutamate-1-semialdehyde 2,1-aminomutase